MLFLRSQVVERGLKVHHHHADSENLDRGEGGAGCRVTSYPERSCKIFPALQRKNRFIGMEMSAEIRLLSYVFSA